MYSNLQKLGLYIKTQLIEGGSAVIVTILLVCAVPLLGILAILLLANLEAYFMKPPQGSTTFIVAGETLKTVIPNISGYCMSKDTDFEGNQWLISEKDEKKRLSALFRNTTRGTELFQKLLWGWFGVRFISLVWPHTHVHTFDLRRGGRRRLVNRNEIKETDAPLRSRVIDSPESTKVSSLLFVAPRPLYVEGLELAGDNSKINLVLLPVFQQVIPSLSVFNLQGDFFTALDAAIEAALVDFFAHHKISVYKDGDNKGEFAADDYDGSDPSLEGSHLTYAHWLKLTKAGEDAPIERSLRNLNVSREYAAKLRNEGDKDELVNFIEKDLKYGEDCGDGCDISKMIPTGIVPRFGFAVVSFRIVGWEPHSSTEALAKSLLAKETEAHTAEGVRKKAEGERDAKIANAMGDSAEVEKLMSAFVGKGVDPNVAARTLETILRTKNIGTSKITTYVEGGSPASVMVPTAQTKEEPSGNN